MKAKLLSMTIVFAMISALSATSAFARTPDPVPAGDDTRTVTASSGKEKVDSNAKLKSDVQKLVADAKAGKVAPRAQQVPSTQRSNLATAAKIGIIVGIAGIVIAIIAIHSANND